MNKSNVVIPAKVRRRRIRPMADRIQSVNFIFKKMLETWTPAFAGVTIVFFAMTLSLQAADDPALIKQGKAMFDQHCARCHGPEGKGDGPDSKRVPVTPRNLTEGVFKFTSTAQGTPLSDEDLMWTLNHGMTGSGMPSFGNLNVNTKKALVAYIKTFSNAFETKPEPLPKPNFKAKVDSKQGQELFTKLQCALCHGEGGRAH